MSCSDHKDFLVGGCCREIPEPTTINEILVNLQQPKPKGTGAEIFPLVMADLTKRMAAGIQTYGESLKAFNGRNALQDAYEEALDLALYLRQKIEEESNGR